MPKLTYFDFDGSRGLECRLALTVAGVEFEDDRIGRSDWLALKPTLPYGALPVYQDDAVLLAHCSPILCYVGKQHGLHPTEPAAAARHEALMNGVEDFRNKVPRKQDTDEATRAAREEFASGWLRRWAETVDGEIQGPFVDGDALSVVDIKLYVIARALLGGTYDHVPLEPFAGFAKIHGLVAAVDAHPAVAAYWAARA